ASTSSVAAARARRPAEVAREDIVALSVEWALRVARVFRNVCATAWRDRSVDERSHSEPGEPPRARSRCGKATTSGLADRAPGGTSPPDPLPSPRPGPHPPTPPPRAAPVPPPRPPP